MNHQCYNSTRKEIKTKLGLSFLSLLGDDRKKYVSHDMVEIMLHRKNSKSKNWENEFGLLKSQTQ